MHMHFLKTYGFIATAIALLIVGTCEVTKAGKISDELKEYNHLAHASVPLLHTYLPDTDFADIVQNTSSGPERRIVCKRCKAYRKASLKDPKSWFGSCPATTMETKLTLLKTMYNKMSAEGKGVLGDYIIMNEQQLTAWSKVFPSLKVRAEELDRAANDH